MKSLKGALLLLGIFVQSGHLYAQADEIAQLALNYEKLAQLKKILQNMYQGYEIVSKGYNTVKGISEGSFHLHDAFLSGLSTVSPAVRNYKRLKDIIDDQLKIAREYKKAYEQFRRDPNFQPQEIDYLEKVYRNLFKQSLENLDALTMVITSSKLRMSDDERISEIDRIYERMHDQLMFLRHFNGNTKILAVQRAREKNDIQTIANLYGIKN
jgi:DNA repair ATPase RecN